MKEKIKGTGVIVGGLLFIAFWIFLFLFFIRGGVWVIENYIDLINSINGFIFWLILLLIVLSVIPRIRIFTGFAIAYATLVWGVLFWLYCLFVTYQLWGFLGLFIGLVIMGIGIFATATIALVLNGLWFAALITVLNIALIYGVRILGYWIATKYKPGGEIKKSEETI